MSKLHPDVEATLLTLLVCLGTKRNSLAQDTSKKKAEQPGKLPPQVREENKEERSSRSLKLTCCASFRLIIRFRGVSSDICIATKKG